VRKATGTRKTLWFLALATQAACTRPNPAYHPSRPRLDAAAAAEEPEVGTLPPDALAADLPALAADLAPDPPDLPEVPDVPGVRPTGLVARWRLDESAGETVVDDKGANPGVLHNGAARVNETFPGARFANPRAGSFDGVDDYVDLGVATLPAIQAAKSVSLWCHPSAVVTAGRRNLIVFNNRAERQSLQLGLEAGYPAVWAWGPDPASLIGATRLEARWYHVAYVYDGAVQRLYIDGQNIVSRAEPPPTAPVAGAYLGCYDPVDDRSELWSGLIDDVRVYDHGLTDAEIAWLAAGGD
jgi:hypothetical protein